MPKTSVWRTRVSTELLMGKIVEVSNIGIERIPCAKVRCSLNEFNVYLKKYFARSFDYYALDRKSIGSLGDTVMIKRIEGAQRPTANVAHSVDRVVFRFGNVTDPITGKRVIKDIFADEQELRKQLVEEIVDKPTEEESLLFEERRAIQQQKLDEQKQEMEEDSTAPIVVKDFVEKRAVQIADLLKVVDNSRLVAGEVTKGPRTAAQRLPRHMRRRAMAYEIRRFPKGFRKFAGAYLLTNHRKKPPCRYYRRRSRNLLLNYIRRQRENVWLETHIWHAKRFHMVSRWGYQLPERSFQRNFRPIYRNSMRHCTVRDKSYLNCLLITANSQEYLIDKLKPFCNSTVSPTFAFKSGLSGQIEVSTLLYVPASYPEGLIGPARFSWYKKGDKCGLALWIHPTCKDLFILHLTANLNLNKISKDVPADPAVPKTYEEWKLKCCEVGTVTYESGDKLIRVEDLKDQLVRLRFYGPKSLDIVKNSIQLSSAEESTYKENHEEWSRIASTNEIPDSKLFSLLIEDPRLSLPKSPKVPPSQEQSENAAHNATVIPHLWNRDLRIAALQNRLTDVELNKLKGDSVARISETPAKIPVIVVARSLGTGKQQPLVGVEIIAPTGFGRDLWIAAQLRTAHASGLYDDLSAHLESGVLAFPADYVDTSAGGSEVARIQKESEEKYFRRPHNRRVLYWKKNSIKYPFTFELPQLVSEWSGINVKQAYFLRDRRAIINIEAWVRGAEAILNEHEGALITLKLSAMARGRPKRFALVCLPTKEDLKKISECRYTTKPFILKESKGENMDTEENTINGQEETKEDKGNFWKDVISLDQSVREKPIALKPLFPDNLNIDKTGKRKIVNRKKKEAKKKRIEAQQIRLAELNEEEKQKNEATYKNAAMRETVGRVLRGDFSFIEARGIALCVVPVCALPKIVSSGGIVLLRNTTSQYYHPARVSVLKPVVDL